MDLENKVRQQLLSRGFTKEQLLNNRGLIGAVIDETALNVVKNLAIHDVVGRSEQLKCQCKKAQFTRTVDADFNPLCGRCGKAL